MDLVNSVYRKVLLLTKKSSFKVIEVLRDWINLKWLSSLLTFLCKSIRNHIEIYNETLHIINRSVFLFVLLGKEKEQREIKR